MSSKLQAYYLQQMGIETWVLRNNLTSLATSVATCTRCPLHLKRTKTVFGEGPTDAIRLMVVGGVPAVCDEAAGRPFVDKAGALLNSMLSSIGLSTIDIYKCPLIKCRPAIGVEVTSEDIHRCGMHLTQQITAVSPSAILAVGELAGQWLLHQSLPLKTMRAKIHDYQGIPVVVTRHPDDLLLYPHEKKQVFEDLWLLKQYCNTHMLW